MIYGGFIFFNEPPILAPLLEKALESLLHSPPTFIHQPSFSLGYGKLSTLQDKDDLWENDHSILIGRVFNKKQEGALCKKEFKDLDFLGKKEILKKIWGKYLYLTRTSSTQVDCVLDPTGQLPFFYYTFPDNSILFASDIDVIHKTLQLKPRYHHPYLASYLLFGSHSSIETPFDTISELPPGCNLTLTPEGQTTTVFWEPSYEPSSAGIVDTLQRTLKDWIQPYENIYVSLSGGLDSSSLVYCLKDILAPHQTLQAINYFHSHIKTSNELPHARAVCEETGIHLIEVDMKNNMPFDPFIKDQPIKPNKPNSQLIGLKSLQELNTFFDHKKSWIFLSGQGSDHIFMRPPTRKSGADFILDHGLKLQGFQKECDKLAHYYRTSLFPVIAKNLYEAIKTRLRLPAKLEYSYHLRKDKAEWWKGTILDHALASLHPIYHKDFKKILPGKREQTKNFYEGLTSVHSELSTQGNPTWYPFLYEPIVDLALSLPTYTLLSEGYDRYPLRQAISTHFHTQHVWRRDKSQTTGVFQLGIKKNIDYLLALCLEGYCAKQGWIDKDLLQKNILLLSQGGGKFIWPLFQLAATELFLTYWET